MLNTAVAFSALLLRVTATDAACPEGALLSPGAQRYCQTGLPEAHIQLRTNNY